MDWISVKEKLPPKNKTILLLHKKYNYIIGYWDCDVVLEVEDNGSFADLNDTLYAKSDILFWMELPEKPKKEKAPKK
jgi:hypothetical protein